MAAIAPGKYKNAEACLEPNGQKPNLGLFKTMAYLDQKRDIRPF